MAMPVELYASPNSRLVGTVAITAAVASANVARAVLPAPHALTIENPSFAFTTNGSPFIVHNEQYYLLSKTYDAVILTGAIGATAQTTPEIDGVRYQLTVSRTRTEHHGLTVR